MPQVDPVILRLTAEVAKYNADISQAHRLTNTKLDAIERKGFQMGQGLKKGFSMASVAALGFVASMGVERVVSGIKASLDYAASLGEIAQTAGVTTQALQEFYYIGTQVGLSTEEVTASLGMFAKRMGEAAGGNKEMLKSFADLGIAIRDTNGDVRPTVDALEDLADKITAMESPAEQAAAAVDFFGRSGLKMLPVLLQGSQGMRQLRQAAHDLGAVLSDELIAEADEAADKIDALALVMKSQFASAIAQNSGAVLTLAKAFATLIGWIGSAITAFTKFKLLQGEVNSRVQLMNPLIQGERRQNLNALAERYRVTRARLDPDNVDQKGGFRDYTLAPLPGIKPAGSVAAGEVTPVPPKVGKVGGAAASPSGPSADDIQRRYMDELDEYRSRIASAESGMARNADERAELELRQLESARRQTLRSLAADEDYSKAQKERVQQAIDAYEEVEKARIEFDRQAAIEQDRARLAEERHSAEQDALQIQYGLARSEAERRDLALQILEAEEKYLKSKLEAEIASRTTTDAEKEMARIALAAVEATSGLRRERINRDTAGPLEAYARKRSPEELRERAESLIVEELDHVRKGIADALSDKLGVGGDPLISGLLNLLLEEILFRPLAEALRGGLGGGGGGLIGGIGSFFGGLFGRASGGYVQGGQMYRVNEGASPGRVEGFIPQGSGTIVPLGRMNSPIGGASSQPAVVQVQVVGGELFDARVQRISGDVSVQVVRAAAPEMIDLAARETMARANRPTL